MKANNNFSRNYSSPDSFPISDHPEEKLPPLPEIPTPNPSFKRSFSVDATASMPNEGSKTLETTNNFVNKIYTSLKNQHNLSNEKVFNLASEAYRHSVQHKFLAEGSQGSVSKWTVPSQDLAEKVCLTNTEESAKESKKALKREIAVLNHCKSNHIVSSLLSGEDSFFLEFAKNGTLSDFSKKPEFDHNQLVDALVGTTLGLKDMHNNGYLHRDLKPDNLLVFDNAAETKISDLGVAEETSKAKDSQYPCGTLGFLAPEVTDGNHFTEKSDMFAFGSTIYSLLTGKPALPAEFLKGDDSWLALLRSARWLKGTETNRHMMIDLLKLDMENEAVAQRVKKLDPKGLIRMLMLSCLEADPIRRPSALDTEEFLEFVVRNPGNRD